MNTTRGRANSISSFAGTPSTGTRLQSSLSAWLWSTYRLTKIKNLVHLYINTYFNILGNTDYLYNSLRSWYMCVEPKHRLEKQDPWVLHRCPQLDDTHLDTCSQNSLRHHYLLFLQVRSIYMLLQTSHHRKAPNQWDNRRLKRKRASVPNPVQCTYKYFHTPEQSYRLGIRVRPR